MWNGQLIKSLNIMLNHKDKSISSSKISSKRYDKDDKETKRLLCSHDTITSKRIKK
jgi:hypothetical protein